MTQLGHVDTLTVLTASANNLATKKIRRVNGGYLKESYNAGKYFSHEERQVASIYDLAAALEKISADPRQLTIRGQLKAERHEQKLVRRKYRDDGAAFDSRPRRYLMVDFDGVPLPPQFDIIEDDPEDYVEWAIHEYLPACFADVSCYWQLSSSAGIHGTDTLYVHIWFWLDRPVADDKLKFWAKVHAPEVDTALFNPVQAHYTARPIFIDCTDPVPVRQGLMEREDDFATFPEVNLAALKQEFAQVQKAAGVVVTGKTFEGRMAVMGDGPGLAGFHAPIRDAIMVFVRHNALTLPVMENLKDLVRNAIHSAPKRPGRDVARYLSDEHLNASILGAITRKDADYIAAESQQDAAGYVGLSEGEARLKQVISDFIKAALGSTPTCAINAELGLGKTRTLLKEIASNPGLKHKRIHYYVPEHKLAQEVADHFNAFKQDGVPAARIHQGRSRTKEDGSPATDAAGRVMCHPEVKEKADIIEQAGVSVSEHFCPTCPFAGECGYQKQLEDRGPGLVIMSQQYACEGAAERADIQVYDESFWQASRRKASVSLSSLSISPSVPRRNGGTDHDADADLADARSKLRKAFAAGDDVPSIQQINDAGITSEIAKRAKAIEHQRADAVTAIMKPEMTAAALKTAWKDFSHRDARRWARVWNLIEQPLELGRDRLHGFRRRIIEDADGDPKDVLYIQWTRDLRCTEIPTLVMDATLDEHIVRRFLPNLGSVDTIRVKALHATVTQVSDCTLSKLKIAPNPDRDDDATLSKKRNNVLDISRLVEVASAHGSTGLISYKATETDMIDRKMVPKNVITGHFAAFRGRNSFKDVDTLVIAGRPQPGENEVEDITEAIFWKDKKQITRTGKYGKKLVRRVINGEQTEVEADAHPDPLVEAVRRQICDVELVQAVGRARAIRRTAENPVHIVLLTSVPIDVPVDNLFPLKDMLPDRVAIMAARGAVLENSADLATAYPDLFPTPKAAARWWEKRSPPSPYKDFFIKAGGTPRRVVYQPPGAGKKARQATIFMDLAAFRNWLSEMLGVEPVRLLEVPPTPEVPAEKPVTASPPSPYRPSPGTVSVPAFIPPLSSLEWERARPG